MTDKIESWIKNFWEFYPRMNIGRLKLAETLGKDITMIQYQQTTIIINFETIWHFWIYQWNFWKLQMFL